MPIHLASFGLSNRHLLRTCQIRGPVLGFAGFWNILCGLQNQGIGIIWESVINESISIQRQVNGKINSFPFNYFAIHVL